MKFAFTRLALALALGSLSAAAAHAQSGFSGQPPAGNFNAPSLVPLPPVDAGQWQSDINYGANFGSPTYTAAILKPKGPQAGAPGSTLTEAPPMVPMSESVKAPAPLPNNGGSYIQPGNESVYGSDYGEAPYSGWGNWGGCPTCDTGNCGNNCCPRWFGYVGGLVMGRDMPNKLWTTYETDNNPNQLMYFPGADWGGGVDTRLGYWFGCPTGNGCGDCGNSLNPYCNCCYENGLEVVYWGVWGLDGQSSIYDGSDNLSTPLSLIDVSLDGSPLGTYYDNARSHRMTRENEFHNVEINFIHIPCCTNCRNLHFSWLAGVRFFRFDEDLQFGTLRGSAPAGAQFGDNPLNEAYLNADVENNLVGFQLGARADYCIHNRWSVFAAPKVGIYGNHATSHGYLQRGNGDYAQFDAYNNNPYNVRASENVFSMLASLDVGFTFAFTPNWSLTAGYRVVGVSGLALSDNQIPPYLAAEDEWQDVDTNGNLILHGGFAGLECRF